MEQKKIINPNHFVGIGCALGYAIVSATARVFVEKIDNQMDPLLPLFFSITLAMSFFHLVNIKIWPEIYRAACLQKKIWYYVMIATGLLWSSFFLGPHYIGADDYAILVFAISGLIGIVKSSNNKTPEIMYNSFISLLYVVAILLVINHETFTLHHFIGFFFGAVSGISLVLFMKFSSQLEKTTSLSSSATLALRWWLTFFVLLIVCGHKLPIFLHQSYEIYLQMTLAAIFGIIFPVYFAQKAAVNIGPKLAAIFLSSTPFFTVLIATSFHAKHFSTSGVVASLLIMFAILLFQFPNLFYRKVFITQ